MSLLCIFPFLKKVMCPTLKSLLEVYKYRTEELYGYFEQMWQDIAENFVEIFSKILKSRNRYLVLHVTLPNRTFHCGFFRDLISIRF